MARVFRRGDAHTPARFWEYALTTENKHARFYDEKGFLFDQQSTNLYNGMSEEKRAKLNFKYINGKKQF